MESSVHTQASVALRPGEVVERVRSALEAGRRFLELAKQKDSWLCKGLQHHLRRRFDRYPNEAELVEQAIAPVFRALGYDGTVEGLGPAILREFKGERFQVDLALMLGVQETHKDAPGLPIVGFVEVKLPQENLGSCMVQLKRYLWRGCVSGLPLRFGVLTNFKKWHLLEVPVNSDTASGSGDGISISDGDLADRLCEKIAAKLFADEPPPHREVRIDLANATNWPAYRQKYANAIEMPLLSEPPSLSTTSDADSTVVRPRSVRLKNGKQYLFQSRSVPSAEAMAECLRTGYGLATLSPDDIDMQSIKPSGLRCPECRNAYCVCALPNPG